MKLFHSVPLLLGFAIFSAASALGGLIGSDFNGVIYDVDPTTGACTNPRSTGLSQVAGFTVTADGQYGYALTSFGSSPPNALFSVNPATGASTVLGNTGLNSIGEGDLCIRPSDGTLYGLWNIAGSTLHMFSLNATTGVATDIGVVGRREISQALLSRRMVHYMLLKTPAVSFGSTPRQGRPWGPSTCPASVGQPPEPPAWRSQRTAGYTSLAASTPIRPYIRLTCLRVPPTLLARQLSARVTACLH